MRHSVVLGRLHDGEGVYYNNVCVFGYEEQGEGPAAYSIFEA